MTYATYALLMFYLFLTYASTRHMKLTCYLISSGEKDGGHAETLKNKYIEDETILEIGVDEAGRGPMLGRVYSGAVILPKDETFKHELMKDSKKFTSEKKINEVADYIKENAIMWNVSYCTEKEIDVKKINKAFELASKNKLKKILDITYEKLVSIDFNRHSASAIVDATLTNVVGENMGKISAWYDNEWGFSNRMCDIAEKLHKIS